mmetsp:Transcript_23534/g.57013  ORF Transcript_23534/g.57013 Transcript_23534/m.57013 type:complete len:470 (-) Transcript_23534:1073-2482(-)
MLHLCHVPPQAPDPLERGLLQIRFLQLLPAERAEVPNQRLPLPSSEQCLLQNAEETLLLLLLQLRRGLDAVGVLRHGAAPAADPRPAPGRATSAAFAFVLIGADRLLARACADARLAPPPLVWVAVGVRRPNRVPVAVALLVPVLVRGRHHGHLCQVRDGCVVAVPNSVASPAGCMPGSGRPRNAADAPHAVRARGDDSIVHALPAALHAQPPKPCLPRLEHHLPPLGRRRLFCLALILESRRIETELEVPLEEEVDLLVLPVLTDDRLARLLLHFTQPVLLTASQANTGARPVAAHPQPGLLLRIPCRDGDGDVDDEHQYQRRESDEVRQEVIEGEVLDVLDGDGVELRLSLLGSLEGSQVAALAQEAVARAVQRPCAPVRRPLAGRGVPELANVDDLGRYELVVGNVQSGEVEGRDFGLPRPRDEDLDPVVLDPGHLDLLGGLVVEGHVNEIGLWRVGIPRGPVAPR